MENMRCEKHSDGSHWIDTKNVEYDTIARGMVGKCLCGERFMMLSDEAKYDNGPSILPSEDSLVK